MLDCLVESVDHAHREYRGEIFRVPVFLGGGLDAGHQLARCVVAAQFDAFVLIDFRQLRQHAVGNAARDE